MQTITRTAVGSLVQLTRTCGIPLHISPNSTLNEAVMNSKSNKYIPLVPTAGMELSEDFNPLVDTQNIKLQYLAIGTGGHTYIQNGSTGHPKPTPKPHKSRDTGLYEMVPFVCKPLSEDLSPTQREKYRLRTVVEIGGVKYAAYFLKRYDMSQYTPNQNIVKVANGSKVATPYKPTVNDLVPADPTISGENDGTYIQTTITLSVQFNEEELEWYREAYSLWFGDDSGNAIISEFAICSGVDKPITKRYPETGNQAIQRINSSLMEAQAVQVNIIQTEIVNISAGSVEYSTDINIGTSDALFGMSYGTTN